MALVVCAAFAGALAVDAGGQVPGFAQFPPQVGEYQVIVLRVVDGDTVEIGHVVTEHARIRGINAPELKSEEGKAARDALGKILQPPGFYGAKLYGREKYGRLLVDFQVGGHDVSKLMIGSGHAKPWDGQGARP
jgi:endonuclease YncB( thermonuclease family)